MIIQTQELSEKSFSFPPMTEPEGFGTKKSPASHRPQGIFLVFFKTLI